MRFLILLLLFVSEQQGAPGNVGEYKGTTMILPWHQVANEEASRDYNEDSEAYEDYQGSEEYQYHYQGSEEYQYHYDGDDYPSYEEGYSEEQVEESDSLEQVRPEIVIDGQTIEVEEGQAVVLPCLVDHLVEEVQVLWSRVDAQRTMIAMGEKVVGEYTWRANLSTTPGGSTLTIGEATFGDSGGYRCELAIGGDRPWVEHMVVVKKPKILTNNALQHYELLQKEATTVTERGLLEKESETSLPRIHESETPLPPIAPLFTSPSTRWSPDVVTTLTIHETSQAPKDNPTPIPPIFLNIPAEERRNDESEYGEKKDGSDYMENGEDEENEDYEGILDVLSTEHGVSSLSSDSKIATTTPPQLEATPTPPPKQDENEWPALPQLFKSSQTPFILVTPSSQNGAEDEVVEEEELSPVPSLGSSSTSSSSTVGVAPSSDHLPVQPVDGPDESSGHISSSVDEPSHNTHQPLSVDGPEEEVVIASVGDDVTLACTAEGHPTPQLSWTRSGKKLEGEDEKVTGDTMTLLRVTPEEAGVYICTAANQHSRPVSRKISVYVEHQPRVELEEMVVQADGAVEVVCTVTGWPKPRVEWRRDGVVTTKGSRRTGQRHTLMVSPGDFGGYSCHATNKLGSAQAETPIAVEPQEPVWMSSAEGALPNTFTLHWDTISLTPVMGWEVQVGEEGDVASKSFQVDAEKEEEEGLRHRGVLKLDHLVDSTAYWAALTTITQESRTEHVKKFYFGTLGAEPRSDRITSSGSSTTHRSLSISILLLVALIHPVIPLLRRLLR